MVTDGNFATYQNTYNHEDEALQIVQLPNYIEVHDIVVYNINYDDYSASASSETEKADGSCASSLARSVWNITQLIYILKLINLYSIIKYTVKHL